MPANRRPSLLDGIDLVVFDKDGTLIDFESMWSGWIVAVAERLEYELRAPVRDELYRRVGFDAEAGRAIGDGPLAILPMAGIRAIVVETVADLARLLPAQAEPIVEAAWFAPDPVELVRPVTDLAALFGALHASGRRVAVATSDDRAPTEATLRALGVRALVDGLACADDGIPVKPDPAAIVALGTELGVPVARIAVVGDSPADLVMGREARAGLVVGVLSGVGSEVDLGPLADVLLASIAELLSA